MLCRGIASLVLAFALFAADPLYRSVSLDRDGQLHIVLDSGKEVLAPKLKGQMAFDDPYISPDRRTVGWLTLYPYPGQAPLAGRLVLYRGGKVLQNISTGPQVFWDWQFQDGGKRVAYSTGPTHFGAALCSLRDVDTGKIIEEWDVHGGKEAPAWAFGLRVE
jgi:hypothetical protein